MKKIKSIIILTLVLAIGIVASGCGERKPTLNVYNWGDYIDKSVIKDFEEEYGMKVVYDTFETNEDLYVKLKQGSSDYDVVIPSDYMIERMIREDMLVKLDKNNVPNLNKVDEQFLNLEFDSNNDYSIPYMWGTVGIIYNKTMVSDPVDSWDILWNKKYENEIFMLNSQRDTIAVSLIRLGYSMNTRNESELEEAKADLIKQKPLVRAYLGDEVKDAMVGEEAAMAVVWSGDAIAMIRQNPDLDYVIPKEGTNLWFDSMVIPKTTKNKEGAEKFIDFMSRPDISARNTDYIGYSTPIPEAVEMLPDDIKNSKVAYPSEAEIKNTEVFKDPLDIIKIYDRIWTEITAEQ
jgi:spermidine/putrescine transport system substrate-binding protein